MKDLSQLPTAIKERRKLLGLTQRQVADLAGCHWTLVLDVEAGRTSVRLDKLVAILEVVGLALGVEEARHHGPA
ncbi:MAG: helix-turn-helix domain-containing protein [Fimbriimonas sp.]